MRSCRFVHCFFILRFLVKVNSNPERNQFGGAGHNPSFSAGATANGTIAVLREAEAGAEVAAELLRKHGTGETMLELEISRLDSLAVRGVQVQDRGEVLGKTAERHTSAEFVAFLTDLVANQPRSKEIHMIADNLSAHKLSVCASSSRLTQTFRCTSPPRTRRG